MTLPRIAVTMGTRPEAIKLAPVVHALRQRSDAFETVVIATGQHRQMLDQVLSLFQITPDVDLNLMRPNQSLEHLTSLVLQSMGRTLEKIRPDLLLVQGDTTTVFASALAAFYLKIPVGHIEAGLRSYDTRNPFPEEINRRLTTGLSEIHFAPTPLARQALLGEAVPPEKIVVTGNTVVDALLALLEDPFFPSQSPLVALGLDHQPFLLVTSHRRESWGQELENICLALKDLVSRFPALRIVYPVHMNPNVRETVIKVLGKTPRVHIIPPVDYREFIHLMRRSYLVMTDSGGVQEEAPTLHKPVLVLRKVTERPEASELGMSRVVGTSREEIVSEVTQLLTDPVAYRAMADGENPYGDGKAAERIVAVLDRWFREESPLLMPEEEFRPLTAALRLEYLAEL